MDLNGWKLLANLPISSSYDGNGDSGSEKPNSLGFGSKPIMIIFIVKGTNGECKVSFAHHSCEEFQTPNGDFCHITFYDTYVEWYSDDGASAQLNESGKKYYYVAITEPAVITEPEE